MPRLLLVDDNPSIHKIAETLLAPTDVELVCAGSAAEALDLVGRGEAFDVALLDTVMTGTDGWSLLADFRRHPATARIPIAMMAGVLDHVEPARLEAAPIQGFLKKPVELRDLGDRIHALLATPVPPPSLDPKPAPAEEPAQELVEEPVAPSLASGALGANPFETLPAIRISDLPELRPEAASAPSEPEDLLLLEEGDLLPEEAALVLEASPIEPLAEDGEEPLDLEELDLGSLRDLSSEPAPAQALPEPPSPASEAAPPVLPAFVHDIEVIAPQAAVEVVPSVPEPREEDLFPDLGPGSEPTLEPEALEGLEVLEAPPLPEWGPTADLPAVPGLLELPTEAGQPLEGPLVEEPVGSAVEGLDQPSEELDVLPPALEAIHEAPLEAPSPAEAPRAPEPEGSGGPIRAEDLVRALLADPAAMDLLVKALVARMGDQVVREVAWEVMPEVAERLNRF